LSQFETLSQYIRKGVEATCNDSRIPKKKMKLGRL